MAEIDTSNSGKSAVPEAQEHFDRGMEHSGKCLEVFEAALENEEPDGRIMYSLRTTIDRELEKLSDNDLLDAQETLLTAMDRTIEELSAAIRLDPKFTAAYIERGDARLGVASGHIPVELIDALPAFSRLGECSSDSGSGLDEEKIQKLKEFAMQSRSAIDDYTAAIRLDSANAHAYLSRADCHLFTAAWEFQKAISDLSEFIRLRPDPDGGTEVDCEGGLVFYEIVHKKLAANFA